MRSDTLDYCLKWNKLTIVWINYSESAQTFKDHLQGAVLSYPIKYWMVKPVTVTSYPLPIMNNAKNITPNI